MRARTPRDGALRERGTATVEYTVGTLGACAVAGGVFGVLNGWFDDTFLDLIRSSFDRTLLDLFETAWERRPKLLLRP